MKNEKVSMIIKTGKWWAIPWWRRDQYYGDSELTKADANNAFLMLRKTFSAKWLVEQRNLLIADARKWLTENNGQDFVNAQFSGLKDKLKNASKPLEVYRLCRMNGIKPRHPLFDELFSEGLLPFKHLVALGRDLLAAKRNRLLGDLPKRLKDAQNYPGAHFELEMLSYLVRKGFKIRRNPASQTGKKKADLRVEKGSEMLFIELKRLELSPTNKNISNISNIIFRHIIFDPDISSARVDLHLELAKDLREKVKKKSGLDDLQRSVPIITKKIKEHIADNIRNKDWGRHVIPGLAEYEMHSRASESIGGQGSFGGLPFSPEAEVKKIFRNAVKEASDQLPTDAPGLLIVNTSFLIDSNRLEGALFNKNNHKLYQQIGAIILVHTHFFDGKVRYQWRLVRNNNAVQDITDYAAVRDILSLSNGI